MTRKRRGRGEGGVWYRKSDHRWVASVSLGYDSMGRRIRRDVYGATKQEALDAKAELAGEIIAGDVEPRRFTVREYLDHWLATKKSLRATTRARYQDAVSVIQEHLGHLSLRRLVPSQIQALYSKLEQHTSRRMASLVHEVLRAALRRAVKWRYLRSNPIDGVERPPRPRRDLVVLDREQLGRFLAAAAGDRLGALYVVAALTGARVGELLALRWADVDLRRSVMRIQHGLVELKGKRWLEEPKTRSSRRAIDLPKRAAAALAAHRKRMMAEGHAGAPVFCDTEGGWLRKSNLARRSFKPLLRAAGLPDVRFHDLRHGLATYLLEEDTHPKKVAALLGHSSVRTTLETYSHVTPAQLKDVADRIDGIAEGAEAEAAVETDRKEG